MSGEAPEPRAAQPLNEPATSVRPAPSGATDTAVSTATPTRAVWERIKHHKVVQWTLAYLALAYTLLHSAEMLGNSLSWSHGLLRLFTLVLILGVPIVVIISWYHGARGQSRVSGTELMIIAILLAIGGTLLWRDSKTERAAEGAPSTVGEHGAENGPQRLTTTVPAPPAASIAVLPFSDLSAEGNQGYFSDGMAEEILNVLAHVNGLKVASRTSSFQFRKSDLGASAIASKLGVRHILEGSVRKAGNTVRVTAQLIDASADQHLWSQSFDRPLSTANLFAIQDEIAKNIVDKLAETMGRGADVAALTARKADTADQDAYELYLQGRSLFVARSPQNLIGAADVLKAAVAKDPKFGRAWEMLGAVLVISRSWGVGDEKQYQAGADAIETALRLDPNLSLAHAVRAEIWSYKVPGHGVLAWEEAAKEQLRAIENDKTNATAYAWRGMDYASLGYFDRAIQDYQRCLEIDTAYELCRRHLAIVYFYLGRTDDALRLIEVGLQKGYLFNDVQLLPAIAARGDRIGALSILALIFKDHSDLILPLFRALTDPTFSDRDRQDAVALVKGAKNGVLFAPMALLILKAYDSIVLVEDDPPIWWDRDDVAWLRSQGRKQAMQYWHLPEYWRKHGFPPQCRPIGHSDFECP